MPNTQVPQAQGGSAHNARYVVRYPMNTEKAAKLGSKDQYVFAVDPSATKVAVAKEIAKRYGVKVASVNTINVKPRAVSFGRTHGTRKRFKKAIVTLVKGEHIDLTTAS